jgi:Zn-dependent protease
MSLVGIVIWVGWLFSLCLREFCHALVAYWGGDTSVKSKGYLIFNPLKKYAHVAPAHRVIFLLIFLLMGGVWLPGGAVYINQHNLRNRWWQSAVSSARPIANILIALILSIFFQIFTRDNLVIHNNISEDSFLPVGIAFLTYLQVFTAIFNLLPIPGLDGYHIIDPWLSKQIKSQFNYFRKYNTLIIIGLLWWSAFAYKIIEMIISNALKIPGIFIEAGLFSFQQTIWVIFSFVVFMIVIWSLGLNYPEYIIEKGKKKATVTNKYYSEPYKTSYQKANSVKENISSQVDPETRKRAIAFAGYDKERIERLLNGARLKNPDRSEQWYWEKILYDMERDRGF